MQLMTLPQRKEVFHYGKFTGPVSYTHLMKPKQGVKGSTDLDEFDFDEYDEDEQEEADRADTEQEDEEE